MLNFLLSYGKSIRRSVVVGNRAYMLFRKWLKRGPCVLGSFEMSQKSKTWELQSCDGKVHGGGRTLVVRQCPHKGLWFWAWALAMMYTSESHVPAHPSQNSGDAKPDEWLHPAVKTGDASNLGLPAKEIANNGKLIKSRTSALESSVEKLGCVKFDQGTFRFSCHSISKGNSTLNHEKPAYALLFVRFSVP